MVKDALREQVEKYLHLPYTIRVQYDNTESNPGWVAWVEELPGCMTYADTKEEIMDMIQDAMRLWIMTALERGKTIPVPQTQERDYSGKFVVRLPKSLHRKISRRAKSEGVSLNQWIATTLAEAVGKSRLAPSQPTVSVSRWPGLAPLAQAALIESGQANKSAEQDEQLVATWLESVAERIQHWLDLQNREMAEKEIQRMQMALRPFTQQSVLVRSWSRFLEVVHRLFDGTGQLSISAVVRAQVMRQTQKLSIFSSPFPEGADSMVEELFGRQVHIGG